MLRKFQKILIWLGMCLIFISFSKAANIYMVPESQNLIKNCDNNIDIMIDTKWEEIFWASTNMQYDRKNIEIVWFYLNDSFNLPMNIENDWLGHIKSAALSMIRDSTFKQTWFTGVIKYATLVIKNKEPITGTTIDLLFSWQKDRTDNMDVFRLWDAQDILMSVQSWSFNFVDGQCLHQAPQGINQMDANYNYQDHINGNLQNITKLEKQMLYIQWIQKNIHIISYTLIIILLIILIIIMYKRWFLWNIPLSILKNKKDENA